MWTFQTVVKLGLYSLIVFVFMAVGSFCGCSRKAQNATNTANAAKKVHVVEAQRLDVEETVYGTGPLAAQDRAVLSAKVPGRVETVLVDLGSSVTKGDLLAEIQKRDFELSQIGR